MTEDEKVKLDYERSAQYFFHLADVRFKLLALLPIASGTGVALVPERFEPPKALALGILGFVVTLGILLYDQRNSQIYNSLVGRLNLIESLLERPPMRKEKKIGGAFIDRPGTPLRRKLFWILPANHGLGLDLIYSASVSAWLFVIVDASAELLCLPVAMGNLFRVLPAILGLLLFGHLRYIDSNAAEGTVPEYVKRRIDRATA